MGLPGCSGSEPAKIHLHPVLDGTQVRHSPVVVRTFREEQHLVGKKRLVGAVIIEEDIAGVGVHGNVRQERNTVQIVNVILNHLDDSLHRSLVGVFLRFHSELLYNLLQDSHFLRE